MGFKNFGGVMKVSNISRDGRRSIGKNFKGLSKIFGVLNILGGQGCQKFWGLSNILGINPRARDN